MGTGKTKVALDTAVHLFCRQEIDGVLVIAPKGCYRNWIEEEIPKHVHPSIKYRMAAWSAAMRKADRWKCDQVMGAKDDTLDFLCINVEAFVSDRALSEAIRFLKNHYGMIVIDESSCIKSHLAKRTKRILKLRDLAEYRRIMTGTPVTENPLAIFTQAEFLDRGLTGFRTFTEFRSYYAIMVHIRNTKVDFWKVEGFRNTEQLTHNIKRFSSRVLKRDCLDLPEKIYETYQVDHTVEQARIYREIQDECLSMFDNGEIVTAPNALNTLMKLHQINCGFIKDDNGEIVHLPSNRIKALMEVIEQMDGKVIIWGHFDVDMELIATAIADQYGPDSYGLHYGLTSDADRADTLGRFKSDPECRFFIGTAASGGRGLTLIQASNMIYYSTDYSLEKRLQSEDRAHRIGQTKNLTIMDLVVPGTIDQKILKAHRSKKDLSATILQDYRELLSR